MKYLKLFENFQALDGVIEDLFFLWDEVIDDDREGMTKGYIDNAAVIDFDWTGIEDKRSAYLDKAEKLLDKANPKVDYDNQGDRLIIYK